MTSAYDRLARKERGDVRAPDGVLAHGWRWVRPPGRLKFAGQWFAHEKLKAFVGKQVLVYVGDYMLTSVDVQEDYGKRIVEIESSESRTKRGRRT